MSVLAICDGAEGWGRIAQVLIPAILTAAWVAVAVLVWRGAPAAARVRAIVAFGVGAAIGAAAILLPHGVSDPDTDYLAQFLVAVAVSACVGVGVALIPPRLALARAPIAGVLGTAVVPGSLVMLLFLALGISGSCID